MSTSMRCRTAPAVTRELVVPADADGDRESVCLGERRTETLPGNTTCTRHAAQLWCCHTQSGASVMRASTTSLDSYGAKVRNLLGRDEP
jgi:hypothetical protein